MPDLQERNICLTILLQNTDKMGVERAHTTLKYNLEVDGTDIL